MKRKALGIVTLVLLAIANAANLLWTIWTGVEQIETGWGYGTNMDILALVPWGVQICCVPIAILSIVYLLIARNTRKKLYAANAILLGALLLQCALTNLWIWC